MPKRKNVQEVTVHHQPTEVDVLRRGLVVGIFTEPVGDHGLIDLNSSILRPLPPHLLHPVILHSGWVEMVNDGIVQVDVARAVRPADHYVVRITMHHECRIILHMFLPEWITHRLSTGVGESREEESGEKEEIRYGQ